MIEIASWKFMQKAIFFILFPFKYVNNKKNIMLTKEIQASLLLLLFKFSSLLQ